MFRRNERVIWNGTMVGIDGKCRPTQEVVINHYDYSSFHYSIVTINLDVWWVEESSLKVIGEETEKQT